MVANKLQRKYNLNITEVLEKFFSERAQMNGNYEV